MSLPAGVIDLGLVRRVALRPPRSAAPLAVASVTALAGLGLDGDRHAAPLSPRQLLLADAHAYAEHGLAPGALRENLLLDVDIGALASGSLLRVGPAVVLRVMFPCEACGRLNVARAGLAGAIGGQRGLLVRVLRGGAIAAGHRVGLLAARLPPWPFDWRLRIDMILTAMPPGHVIDYGQLAQVGGIPSGYCRAFPRAIAALGPAHAGRALPQRCRTNQPRWLGQGLFDAELAAIDL